MNKNNAYTGFDYFRGIAALLIIAIHTSPLTSYNETADFVLTRIIARIAVPFFFMLSGFFLISRYNRDTEKLRIFLKNTFFIYGAAILIYIPVNIYNSYFSMDNLFPNIIKDLVFDGTMYHLWYLPASMAGGCIAWLLVKKLGFRRAAVITAILYTMGLLGDSYYGICEKIPVLKNLYTNIFQVSDYTRNGIFLAPVFFVMGGITADQGIHLPLKNNIAGLLISLVLMILEGSFLHHFGAQRHDSMYIMLLPCMYFLFASLTFWKGHRVRFLRTLSMIIYIIHPLIIIIVRMAAKILHMQAILVENSMMHFISVSIASVFASMAVLTVFNRIHSLHKKACKAETDRTWAEIDLNNLKHNARVLQNAMPPGCDLMAVVKANAYGHGSFEISTCLERIGVKSFAVATLEEGITLRSYGIQGEILILGYTNPGRAKDLHKYDLMQSLIDYPYAVRLNSQGYRLKVHIKVDTGMHRLGFDFRDTGAIARTFRLRNLSVRGIFSHLCAADSREEEDIAFTQEQIMHFYEAIDILKKQLPRLPKIHIQSSYGFLNYPELKCDYARIGIALYGILSSPEDTTALDLDLRPVLSLRSRVILTRNVKCGESVGYGRAFTACRNSRIAILPVGYADGFPRSLSCGQGYVIIRDSYAPVIGRICMDQLAVDITDIPDVKVGDIATLIGRTQHSELTAPETASCSDSISNELLSRLGPRVKITASVLT